jgi:hypothetical protein
MPALTLHACSLEGMAANNRDYGPRWGLHFSGSLADVQHSESCTVVVQYYSSRSLASTSKPNSQRRIVRSVGGCSLASLHGRLVPAMRDPFYGSIVVHWLGWYLSLGVPTFPEVCVSGKVDMWKLDVTLSPPFPASPRPLAFGSTCQSHASSPKSPCCRV